MLTNIMPVSPNLACSNMNISRNGEGVGGCGVKKPAVRDKWQLEREAVVRRGRQWQRAGKRCTIHIKYGIFRLVVSTVLTDSHINVTGCH